MVLRKSFYIRWSAGRSPRVHEVNPGWDPSVINLFYYIHIHIHNTSLGCLLYVYFIFSYGLGRDFTWGNSILGNQQHIQHH